MQQEIEKNIIKTLSYSDIFSYPLKRSEIFKYYMGTKVEREVVYEVLKEMVSHSMIGFKNGFYFLNGKESLCVKRIRRGRESERKWNIARKVSFILSFIPTIKVLGISGSLSMDNCEKQDDIDLFIITSKNTLWITRMLVNFVLLAVNAKRSRNDTYGIDKICPNMFLTSGSLQIEEDIFKAHEIAQLKVVVNKDSMYEKFMAQNSWVLSFMPNAIGKFKLTQKIEKDNFLVYVLNKVLFGVQYMYMKRRITKETVSLDRAFFHPKDKTNVAGELFRARYENYNNYLSDSITRYTPIV